MTPSTFPTFLTFLTRKPCFPAFAAAPWQGPEITPYGGQHRLEFFRPFIQACSHLRSSLSVNTSWTVLLSVDSSSSVAIIGVHIRLFAPSFSLSHFLSQSIRVFSSKFLTEPALCGQAEGSEIRCVDCSRHG